MQLYLWEHYDYIKYDIMRQALLIWAYESKI